MSHDSRQFSTSLTSRSFLGLLVTQFLTAFNDNMFRWFVVPIAYFEPRAGMGPLMDKADALSLGLVCFTVPYLVFASTAGFLADRFSKRNVIVACKVAEVVLMTLALTALWLKNLPLLFVIVFLTGAQSALFSPAKYGAIPELLDEEHLSKGNGLMGLVTVVASALGTVAGFWLFDATRPDLRGVVSVSQLSLPALCLLGVALTGLGASLLIRRLPAAAPKRTFPRNPFADTIGELKLLFAERALFRAALGIAFFWFLASLANVNVNAFAIDVLHLPEKRIGLLMAALVVGVASGSVLAGLLSGGKVELGLVPLGSLGIAVSSVMLFVVGQATDTPAMDLSEGTRATTVWLLLLGISAGFFDVPLEAFLQYFSDPKRRGSILAASNFLTFLFILVSAGVFYSLQHALGENASAKIFLLAGLGTLPVTLYVVYLIPHATIRFIVWCCFGLVYRLRVIGRDNLPERGGALIVANHVSWIDGILIMLSSSRNIRMIAWAEYIRPWPIRWLADLFGVIPIDTTRGPKAVLEALKQAREAVMAGDLVCIFAEGQLTRTGQLQPFRRGFELIVEGTDIPIIPAYLDELWGSIFSYAGGRFFWKWPRRWPYPVTIVYGRPMKPPQTPQSVRLAVEELGAEAVRYRNRRTHIPVIQFLRRCRRQLWAPKIADSSGARLSAGRVIVGTLAFARLLRREVLSPDEQRVGVLLPPSAGGALANTALAMLHRVSVNLNYTLSDDVLNYCIEKARIRHVLTSRRFVEKRPVSLNAELVFLEDLRERIGTRDRVLALLQAYLLPASVLERLHGLHRIEPDELFTIIFTSGSTGRPKGVMLSHRNVASNVMAADHLLNFRRNDVALGILPFFHSFGYTFLLWLPLMTPARVVYHFNPLDARMIGKLCEEHGVTILAATPTFLKAYMRRCTPEQFRTLDLVIAGAEKLPPALAEDFQKKYGIYPTEGYGTTELSPLAAVNVPPNRSPDPNACTSKPGTVGRVIPNCVAKVVDVDTFEDLPSGRQGMLLIKGPNVMLGYLDEPEKTAEVIRDGWYVTGDLAIIDDDGFITLSGRLSRFSKIGGEMVPHVRIEAELIKILQRDTSASEADEDAGPQVAVTAVPDEKKGERLIVLHTPLQRSVTEIVRELKESGLPNLWIPSPDSFYEVDSIPVLGSGKLDLKRIQQLALELTRRESPSTTGAGGESPP
ncbi:MAG: MFS transporter, partial [Planctomycetota bacterium]